MALGDPFRLIEVLSKHGVRFVVIGGHAVIYHGFVRATEDTDVIVVRDAGGDGALLRALQEVNAQWIGDEIDPATGIEKTYPVTAEFVRASRLMMLITDHGFLDIFDDVPGYPEVAAAELFESAERSGDCRFVSLAWLRKLKQASGRPKDRTDLEHLPKS